VSTRRIRTELKALIGKPYFDKYDLTNSIDDMPLKKIEQIIRFIALT